MTYVNFPIPDPTLEALDTAMIEKSKRETRRLYLGMSSIGNECSRQQWYGFRWAIRIVFDAVTLRRFQDGFAQEDVAIDRLRAIPGITLLTVEPETGRQIGYSDHGGHFRGHMDGDITGILQAPKTPHVWEHKSTNEKKFKKLDDLKLKLGEKSALREWDGVYFAQGVLYMEYGGYKRHYLTASTPGGREYTSVRTDANPKAAKALIKKAERIIFDDTAPDRIAGPDFFKCKWCDFSHLCHEGQAADRNCRTCLHASVLREGGWACHRFKEEPYTLNPELQAHGCNHQRYLPSLVPGELVNASQEENWVEYKFENGRVWRDQGAIAK